MPHATLTPAHHYLNDGYGVRSWLLTRDHKRIALLYLAGITFFFFVGGAQSRHKNITRPDGDQQQSTKAQGKQSTPDHCLVFCFRMFGSRNVIPRLKMSI